MPQIKILMVTCAATFLAASAAGQSSTHCDLPDASAASAHFDGSWKVSGTHSGTGEVQYTLRDCTNPVQLSALSSTQLAREGGLPINVLEVDGSTIMWIDEKGQAVATKPLNGSFMLMRYGFGHNRSEYEQVLRYDRCPAAESDCVCDAAP